MDNRYGLDASYFTRKLERLLSDIDNYTPEEFARAIARLSITADKNVVLEPEFQKTQCHDEDTHLIAAAPKMYEMLEYIKQYHCTDKELLNEIIQLQEKARGEHD